MFSGTGGAFPPGPARPPPVMKRPNKLKQGGAFEQQLQNVIGQAGGAPVGVSPRPKPVMEERAGEDATHRPGPIPGQRRAPRH